MAHLLEDIWKYKIDDAVPVPECQPRQLLPGLATYNLGLDPATLKLPEHTYALEACEKELLCLLRHSPTGAALKASGGAGKTQYVPSMLAEKYAEKDNCWVLVLSPVPQDFGRLVRSCPVSARSIAGCGDSSGTSASLVTFMSAGYAAKYLKSHPRFWAEYDVIIFDEADHADVPYSITIKRIAEDVVASRPSLGHRAMLFTSASLNPANLPFAQMPFLNCHHREFPLQKLAVDVDEQDKKTTAARLAGTIWRSGRSALVFLPGKEEIKEVNGLLAHDGVLLVSELHAGIPREELSKRMQEMKPCVFLATDVAARGVTLPNTHIVIDTNLERTIEGTVPVVKDALATLDMRLQKSVRAGRCAPGLAILLNHPSYASDIGIPDEALLEALCCYERDDIRALPLPITSLQFDRQWARLQQIVETPAEREAVSWVPLSVTGAKTFLKATELGVAWETAAVECAISSGLVVKKQSVHEVIGAVSAPTCPPGQCRRKWAEATRLFRHMTRSRCLKRSALSESEISDAIAAAYVAADEFRLCRRRQKRASFRGHVFEALGPDGWLVAVAFNSRGECSCMLPVTEGFAQNAGIVLPLKTASVYGDSTLKNFPEAVLFALRQRGYDVRAFSANGGAKESEVAVDATQSEFVDLLILVPNGNGLMKLTSEEDSSRQYIFEAAGHLAAVAKRVASRVACFVGNPELSAGAVHNMDSYTKLTASFSHELRNRGIPVLRDAAVFQRSAGDLHWDILRSGAGVSALVSRLSEAAAATSHIVPGEYPPTWRLEEFEGRWMKAKCNACKKHCDENHYTSARHKWNYPCSTSLPPSSLLCGVAAPVEVHPTLLSGLQMKGPTFWDRPPTMEVVSQLCAALCVFPPGFLQCSSHDTKEGQKYVKVNVGKAVCLATDGAFVTGLAAHITVGTFEAVTADAVVAALTAELNCTELQAVFKLNTKCWPSQKFAGWWMLDLEPAVTGTRKALKDTLLRHTRKSNLHLSVPAFQSNSQMTKFTTGVTTTAPTTAPPAVDLPCMSVWSDMGYFFWNTQTKETSWSTPAPAPAPAPASAPAPALYRALKEFRGSDEGDDTYIDLAIGDVVHVLESDVPKQLWEFGINTRTDTLYSHDVHKSSHGGYIDMSRYTRSGRTSQQPNQQACM